MRDQTFYMHFPLLHINTEYQLLGGILAPFLFSEFEKLDRDWATSNYFNRSYPTVWKINSIENNMNKCTELGMLIYNAILATTGHKYPNPLNSMIYYYSPPNVHRRCGCYDRTYLLNGNHLDILSNDELMRIKELSEKWAGYGLTHEDAVFLPLKALSLTASGSLSPILAALPIVVSLEGYLLEDETKGISKELAKSARFILGDSYPLDIEQLFRVFYAWRSEIIHGRFPSERYTKHYASLQRIVADIVIKSIDLFMYNGLNGDNITDFRKQIRSGLNA